MTACLMIHNLIANRDKGPRSPRHDNTSVNIIAYDTHLMALALPASARLLSDTGGLRIE